jgi:hypothetical protein
MSLEAQFRVLTWEGEPGPVRTNLKRTLVEARQRELEGRVQERLIDPETGKDGGWEFMKDCPSS